MAVWLEEAPEVVEQAAGDVTDQVRIECPFRGLLPGRAAGGSWPLIGQGRSQVGAKLRQVVAPVGVQIEDAAWGIDVFRFGVERAWQALYGIRICCQV